MPWDVFKKDNEYCVHKIDDDGEMMGESLGCHKSRKEAMAQMKALHANTDEKFEDEPIGFGWTLLAVAATNRPGTQQKGHELSLATIDGRTYIRTPIVKKSVIRNRGKVHRIDQTVFDQVLRNHTNEVWDSAPYLRVSHEEGETRPPALCWFDKDSGGFLRQEKNWLVGYALPADAEVEDAIKKKKWRYASADLHPDYTSNQIAVLETATFEYLSDNQLKEIKMDEKEKERLLQLEQERTDLLTRLEASAKDQLRLQEQVKELSVKLSGTSQPQLDDAPAWVKEKLAQLEKENMALAFEREQERKQAQLERRVAKAEAMVARLTAKRDNGYILPAVVIETAKSLVLAQPIGEGDRVIQLEATRPPTVEELMDYYFEGVQQLVNLIPPMVRLEGQTETTDVRLETLTGPFGYSPAELAKKYAEKAEKIWSASLPAKQAGNNAN